MYNYEIALETSQYRNMHRWETDFEVMSTIANRSSAASHIGIERAHTQGSKLAGFYFCHSTPFVK